MNAISYALTCAYVLWGNTTKALGRRRRARAAEEERVTEGVRLIASKPAPGRHRAPEPKQAPALTPPVDPWAGQTPAAAAVPMRRQIGAGWGVPAWRAGVFA